MYYQYVNEGPLWACWYLHPALSLDREKRVLPAFRHIQVDGSGVPGPIPTVWWVGVATATR